MLIVPVKDGENIERALKRYKRKFDKTNTMKQLRARQQFTKPSVIMRQQRIRSAYKQRMQSIEI
jgi:small subunit ribosomal protein S21